MQTKSFIVFVAKRKKVCIEVCDLTCECKEQNMGFLTTLMILAYQSCQWYIHHDLLLFMSSFLLLSNSTSHLPPLQPLCKYTIPKDKCFFWVVCELSTVAQLGSIMVSLVNIQRGIQQSMTSCYQNLSKKINFFLIVWLLSIVKNKHERETDLKIVFFFVFFF